MNRILLALLVLALGTLACSTTFIKPTANLSADVSPTEQALPSPTITITVTASPETCQVIADALHVRDAPNIDGIVIAWLRSGDQLTILPDPPSGDWIRVQSGPITGWINSHYCER
jgi:hypothetical protein